MRFRLLQRVAVAMAAISGAPAVSAAPASAAAVPEGRTFATPQAAAAALYAAWKSGRGDDVLKIFGPEGRPLVASGDPVAEKSARERLAAAFARKHTLEPDGGGRVVLVVGSDDWPYPIPIEKRGAGWRFDVKAGETQILDRRIGRDERDAIQTCRAYVAAQREFGARNRTGKVQEYAQKVESTPGRHDGLYWRASDAGDESPLGPRIAAAEAKGYGAASRESLAPFEGYYFRILTAQGPHAPGGARSYIVNGHMTGGFALIAYPARYGDSGVMTFIVNQTGVVFQRNLGPQTARLAGAITAFDPDRNWRIADP